MAGPQLVSKPAISHSTDFGIKKGGFEVRENAFMENIRLTRIIYLLRQLFFEFFVKR